MAAAEAIGARVGRVVGEAYVAARELPQRVRRLGEEEPPPTGAATDDPGDSPVVERTQGVVRQAERKVSEYASVFVQGFKRSVARAREEYEDVVAEARGGRRPAERRPERDEAPEPPALPGDRTTEAASEEERGDRGTSEDLPPEPPGSEEGSRPPG